MTRRLLELPLLSLGLVMVGLAVAITFAGARLTRDRASSSSNEALGALHATISTIYTVLLAFVVVIVWQQFSDAEGHVETEATRLSNILRDSRAFDEPARSNMHNAVLRYIDLASTGEWHAMAEGTGPDRPTTAAYEQIWEIAYRMQPTGVVQEAFYDEMLVRLNELGAARRTRLLSAQTSVPWALWALLVVGGALVLYISFLLPTGSDARGRRAALASTSCVIALTLFVIFVFDHPYSGGISVEPTPLTDLLSR
ncbi:MAG: DUF4239 domain-containing protein [Actinomycetota bacterium]|nr:DUF4239 domain-containing protein [Actinomycetota bacterium]